MMGTLSDGDMRVADLAVRGRSGTGPVTIRSGGVRAEVGRVWPGGFSLAADRTAGLRGSVDLYAGDTFLGSGLAVAMDVVEGERIFAFKRFCPARSAAPSDFAPDDDLPAGRPPAPSGPRRPML